jgi:hypothetical protein
MILPSQRPTHCLRRIITHVLSLAISLATFTPNSRFSCFGQENGAPGAIESRASEIKLLSDEYDAHMQKRKLFEGSYQRIENVLKDTERDFEQLRLENLQQQTAMVMTAFNSLQFSSLPTPQIDLRTQNLAELRNQSVAVNNYLATANLLNTDAVMRSEQVRQLNATQQTTVRKRIEALNDFQKLQSDYAEWQAKWPTLLDGYWRHTDPEGIRTKSENEAVLEQLKLAKEENTPAKIAQGLIEIRLGHWDEANAALTQAIEQNTSLNAVAYASRAVMNACREEKQKSKSDMQQAFKLAPKNIYVSWLKAMLAAKQGDYGAAKKELNTFTSKQEHEIAARRLLAVLYSTAPKISARDAAMAMQHAQLVSDMTGEENWYSELVLAIALNASGKSKESLQKAEHAKQLAKEENIELCDCVIDSLETKKPIDWKFFR